MGGPGALRLLFVYGSLCRGGSAHELLEGAESLGRARFQGRAHERGGYPVAVPSADERDAVHGELFRLPDDDLEGHLARLDRYEGEGYRRERVTVRLAGGAREECWIYLARRGGEKPVGPADGEP